MYSNMYYNYYFHGYGDVGKDADIGVSEYVDVDEM